MLDVEGSRVCEYCYKEKTSECVGCNERFWNTNLTILNAGKVCDNCLDDFHSECDECGETFETESEIYETTLGNFCVHCVHENYILKQTDHEYACDQYETLSQEERLPAGAWLRMHPQWSNLERFLTIEDVLDVFHLHRVDRREALPSDSFDEPSDLFKYCFSYAFEKQEGFTNEQYEFWNVIFHRLLTDGS
jgi:hypothetical protein